MKTFVFSFLSLLLLVGCSVDPKETAILDYIQTVGDTKTDMSPNILELRKERDMVAMDSAIIVWVDYKQKRDFSSSDENMKSINSAQAYLDEENKKIGEYWFCQYKIKNPLLNNAQQEIATYFVFKNDNVISTMDTEYYQALTKEVESGSNPQE